MSGHWLIKFSDVHAMKNNAAIKVMLRYVNYTLKIKFKNSSVKSHIMKKY